MPTPLLIRRLSKSKGLRLINIAGLSLLFACLLISYAHIRWEMSFDKMFTHSGQIARLSLGFDGQPADGRIYMKEYDKNLKKYPEITDVLTLSNLYSGLLTLPGEKIRVDNLFLASNNFFSFFDTEFIAGTLPSAFDSNGKVVISDKLALRLFGKTDVIGKTIDIENRRLNNKQRIISGVYKQFPLNAHFHPNIIICNNGVFDDQYAYYYLKTAKNTDLELLSKNLAKDYLKKNQGIRTVDASLTPLTDIHLRSRVLREIEPNGNIDYVYLIAAVNLLLLVVVLFNLWLNSNVIFTSNRRHYFLLRINGAGPTDILRAEISVSLLLGTSSLLLGTAIALITSRWFGLPLDFLSIPEILLLSFGLLLSVVVVSALPCFADLIKKSKLSINQNKNQRFSYSGVKYMLVVQYTIVFFILIQSFVMHQQMNLIAKEQIGANRDSILVMQEQPPVVISHFELLKQEAEKQPNIEMVSGAMQLPGNAIRDGVNLFKERDKEGTPCPVMVTGTDFFPFFNIHPIAGTLPAQGKLTIDQENQMLEDKFAGKKTETNIQDEYVINEKLRKELGYSSPEEAIGKTLRIDQFSLDYIPTGRISAVVPDFIYSNVFEDTTPLLFLQRKMFTSCFMLRFPPGKSEIGLAELKKVWSKINPGFPFEYSLLSDTYKIVYRNEIRAQQIVNIFTALSLMVTLLGLLVFMSFMVKARKREIGIRKVNGASEMDILQLLNMNFLVWIGVAFVIAAPLSIITAHRWLANFVFKTELPWWIFAGAGIAVVSASVLLVSCQSLRASRINPVESIQQE